MKRVPPLYGRSELLIFPFPIAESYSNCNPTPVGVLLPSGLVTIARKEKINTKRLSQMHQIPVQAGTWPALDPTTRAPLPTSRVSRRGRSDSAVLGRPHHSIWSKSPVYILTTNDHAGCFGPPTVRLRLDSFGIWVLSGNKFWNDCIKYHLLSRVTAALSGMSRTSRAPTYSNKQLHLTNINVGLQGITIFPYIPQWFAMVLTIYFTRNIFTCVGSPVKSVPMA